MRALQKFLSEPNFSCSRQMTAGSVSLQQTFAEITGLFILVLVVLFFTSCELDKGGDLGILRIWPRKGA